jgi:thiol:disulfide interchange protein DsbD
MNLSILSLPLLLWALTFPTFAFGEDQNINENPVQAKVTIKTPKIPVGVPTSMFIDLEVADHHKAYVDMFKVKFKGIPDLKVIKITADPSFKFEDKFSKKIREGVKGKSTLTVDFELPLTSAEGERKDTVEFTYQACTETYCMFPTTTELPVSFVVTKDPGSQDQLISDTAATPESGDALQNALNKGKFYAFLFVFLAGVLTSLTPCIFPMIPITLAIIGARAAEQSKFRGFTLSLSYVLGIAVTYACLGVLAAKTGALFGSYLGHPLVVSGIALVFVIMGLSMYGLFEITVPAFVTNKLSSKKTDAGYFGAFATGLIAGVVASPCVGPVLVSILTFVAESKNLVFGFALLFVFALGLGQLFLVLGTFGSLLKKLPKSGGWMDVVKFVFGTTMIGAALYYLRPVTNDRLFYALMALVLILISSAFGAFAHTQTLSIKGQMQKGLMVATFVIGLAYGVFAVMPQISQTVHSENSTSVDKVQKLDWQHYSDSLLAQAQKEQKPVIIDFWADWCVACKELEMLTFSNASVRELSKDFVLLKINATNSTEEINRLKKKYKVVGLPTIIFYNNKGQIMKDLTLTGFESAKDFQARMKSALK